MIFLRIIRLLVKIIPEKKILFKNFSKSGGGAFTYRQIIKIKKIFQNMIFCVLYDSDSKKFLRKEFWSKIFLSLGWGHLQVKRQNSRKNSIHDFLANYTILSLNNFLKKIFGQKFFQVWGRGYLQAKN